MNRRRPEQPDDNIRAINRERQYWAVSSFTTALHYIHTGTYIHRAIESVRNRLTLSADSAVCRQVHVSHLIGVPTMSLSWKLSGWFHSFKLLRQRLHYSVDVINSDHHWRGCQTHRQLVVVLVTHTVRQTDRQTDMRIVKRIVSQWENIEWSHQCDNEWHTWRQL